MIGDLPRHRLLAAVTILVICLCDPALAQKLVPVDEATMDPSLIVFRDNLRRAVERRDTDFVVSQASSHIHISFGGDYGRDVFRERLTGTGDWQGEPYWQELQQALSLALGESSWQAGLFCAPYISCAIMPDCAICDSFSNVYALKADAPVYAAPDTSATVIARLSYDILRIARTSEPVGGSWIAVESPGGGIGHVDLGRSDFRAPEHFRAFFEKTDGSWQMTVFIAGD